MKNIIDREVSVVLVGDFNPAIFHPVWFASQDLLGKLEADNAEIEVTHKNISIFTIDWLRVEVTRERFVATLSQDGFEALLLDFVAGTFKKLSHTPVRAVGLNRNCTFSLSQTEEWHALGHKLVPKDELWNDLIRNPGTKTVTVTGLREEDCETPGQINIRVEPSGAAKNAVHIDVNDHYQLDQNKDEKHTALDALAVIEKNWETSDKRADNVYERIFLYGSSE